MSRGVFGRRAFAGWAMAVGWVWPWAAGFGPQLARGDVLHVWAESPAPAPPYDRWDTAAQTIQEAVDAAESGDVVLVRNGVYATGGRAIAGTLTNRVAVPTAVTIRSVQGPEVTVIQGAPAAGGGLGEGAVRCVWLGAGAVLEGFTLTGGHTEAGSGEAASAGGGVWGISTNSSVLTNCILRANAADVGAGAYGVRMLACRIEGNRARFGGGAANCRLETCRVLGNEATESGGGVTGDLSFDGSGRHDASHVRTCVIAGNRAGTLGGGAAGGTVVDQCTITGNTAGLRGGGIDETVVARNSILYFNRAPSHPEYAILGNGSLDHCCSRPLPAGEGNLDSEPQLLSASHLGSASPCLAAGAAEAAGGWDLDGEPWRAPPSMGADEPSPLAGAAGALRVWIRPERPQVVAGSPLEWLGVMEGRAAGHRWDFGDGTVVTQATYQAFVAHTWDRPGRYAVTLTAWNDDFPSGVIATGDVEVVEGRYFVDASSPTPVAPFATWATAARTIDDAVQAALPNSQVVVTNGVYDLGGRPSWGEMARVVIDKPLRVESVNGPARTILRGEPGRRCVVLGAGAVVSGFTLTQGESSVGSGVYSDASGVVTNCVIVDNRAGLGAGVYGNYGALVVNCRIERNAATGSGGGVAGATVVNSVLADNVAGTEGGGAWGGTLRNCTVTGNRAEVRGGGVAGGDLLQSIVLHNASPEGPNHAGVSTARFSCTTPLPPGQGNLEVDPRFTSAFRLAPDSPCLGAGATGLAEGVDIDGEPWRSPPSLGADEVVPGNLDGPLDVAIALEHPRVADGFDAPLRAVIEGRVARHVWEFGDGTTATNTAFARHAWRLPGRYEVRLTAFNADAPEGATASARVDVLEVRDFLVDPGSPRPEFPYATWATAARDIQAAVEASVSGRRVWVAPGVYASGSRRVGGRLDRLHVDRAVRVESVGGPAVTAIRGEPLMRGVRLAAGAVLSGFTVTNGAVEGDGAGLWCDPGAVVTNCWIRGNEPWMGQGAGGGVYGGVLQRCRLDANRAARGGGAAHALLEDCALTDNVAYEGGGAADSILRRCRIEGNRAEHFRGGSGGGASSCDLSHCLVRGNAAQGGGGAAGGRVVHCTVTDNTAGGLWWMEPRGGGVGGSEVINSIVYFNLCLGTTNRAHDNHFGGTLAQVCTTPLPEGGSGLLDADPDFLDRAAGDYHLRPDSPCLDRGVILGPTGQADLEGTPRPLDGTGDGLSLPDLGAYEFLRPASDSNGDGLPDGWTWAHGLDPTDPTVAIADPDGDGVVTGDEWTADTDPRDPSSWFRIEGIEAGPTVAVTVLGSVNRVYGLETRADLGGASWSPVAGQQAVGGGGTILTLRDTNVIERGFYRVTVRLP